MSRHVQALECRTLFAATIPVAVLGDLVQLRADSLALKASLMHQVPVLHVDGQSLAKDLKGLPNSAQNRPLLGKLRVDEAHSFATLGADVTAMFKLGHGVVGKLVVDAMRFAAHPTDAALRAKLAADVTVIQGAATGLATKFLSDLESCQTTLVGDLNALSAANPGNAALGADVAKAKTDSTGLVSTVQSSFQTIQGDFQKMLADMQASM